MTYIVHWKDVVGKEHLETFIKVERAIIAAQRMQIQDPVEVVRKKLNDDEAMEMWAEKRRYMRKCGYEVDGKIIRWLGWYTSYLESGEVKFKTTADRNRKYISMNEFLEFKRNYDHAALENDYYHGQENIKQLVNSIKKHEFDDVFIPEEEEDIRCLYAK